MSASSMKVLVTATGGDLGQAIVKCLRLGKSASQIHGSDMHPGIGSLFVDEFHTLPPAFPHEPYIRALDELCRRYEINAVIPACEPEIRSLGQLAAFPQLPSGARIVSQPQSVTEGLGDKLKCFQALKGKVPLADFADGKNRWAAEAFVAKHGFPLCMKERVSSGKRGVKILQNAEEFEREWPHFTLPLMQAFIGGEDLEYSVGVFVEGRNVRLISYRRKLGWLGCSSFAELDQPAAVMTYCQAVATSLPVQGSYNIQLRISDAGPLLLEINPRFSSLAAARAACGFNDVEWSLLQATGRELPPCPPPPAVFRYQRYINEAMDFGSGLHAMKELAPRTV